MFNNTKKEVSEGKYSSASTIIGKGTSLNGDLDTVGNLRIEGKLGGSVRTKAKVVLGDTSVVEGNIVAQNAEVGGEVQGTIRITGLLTLKPTAVVNGDIITSKLVLEEGAKFNGKCDMGGLAKATKPTPPSGTAHTQNGSSLEPTIQQAPLRKKGAKVT